MQIANLLGGRNPGDTEIGAINAGVALGFSSISQRRPGKYFQLLLSCMQTNCCLKQSLSKVGWLIFNQPLLAICLQELVLWFLLRSLQEQRLAALG